MKMTRFIVAAGSLVALIPLQAEAYIGPGAGLSAIGSVIALVAAVAIAVFGFVWFPVRRILRRRKEAAMAAKSHPAGDQIGNDGKAESTTDG